MIQLTSRVFQSLPKKNSWRIYFLNIHQLQWFNNWLARKSGEANGTFHPHYTTLQASFLHSLRVTPQKVDRQLSWGHRLEAISRKDSLASGERSSEVHPDGWDPNVEHLNKTCCEEFLHPTQMWIHYHILIVNNSYANQTWPKTLLEKSHPSCMATKIMLNPNDRLACCTELRNAISVSCDHTSNCDRVSISV